MGVNGGTNRNIAIWGSTLIDGSADNQIYAIDVHTGNQGLGNGGDGGEEARAVQRRADHRQRQGDYRPSMSARCGQRRLHHHGARRGRRAKKCGGRGRFRCLARAGYETWGDVPMAERWHVGSWMVPSYDPELDRIFVGHVGHDPTDKHASWPETT